MVCVPGVFQTFDAECVNFLYRLSLRSPIEELFQWAIILCSDVGDFGAPMEEAFILRYRRFSCSDMGGFCAPVVETFVLR